MKSSELRVKPGQFYVLFMNVLPVATSIVLLLSACSALNRVPRLPNDETCISGSLHAVSRVPLLWTDWWRSRSEIRSCNDDKAYEPGNEVDVFTYSDKPGVIVLAAREDFREAWRSSLEINVALGEFFDFFAKITARKTVPPFLVRAIAVPESVDLEVTEHAIGHGIDLTFYFPYRTKFSKEEQGLAKVERLKVLSNVGHEVFHALAASTGGSFANARDEEEAAHLMELCLLGRMAAAQNLPVTLRFNRNPEYEVGEEKNAVDSSISGMLAAMMYLVGSKETNITVELADDAVLSRVCNRALELAGIAGIGD